MQVVSRTVHEPARDLPLVAEVDVAVAGGGTAGVMAALGACRAGARTCLIERLGSVGGAMGMGLIGHLANRYRDHLGRDLVGGAPREFLERLIAAGATPQRSLGEALNASMVFVRHELCAQTCLEMLTEAGADLWLHTRVCRAVAAPGGGYHLFIETKSGRQAILARQVIDCTGEADVASFAGAPLETGTQRSWGLLFEMTGVDVSAYESFLTQRDGNCPGWAEWLAARLHLSPDELRRDRYWGEWLDGGRRAWKFRPEIMAAVDAGHLALIRDLPGGGQIRYGWDGFWPEPWHGPDTVTANVCMVTGLNPSEPRQVTQAEIAARSYMMQFVAFLRSYLPGFARAAIRIVAAQTMSRGGREIVGAAVISPADYESAGLRPDRICLTGTTQVVGLPLGMFVPQGTPDLLVAGKCAAGGYGVRASVACMAAGYSCGILAALAAQQGTTPLALAPDCRRQELLRHGVLLEPAGPLPGARPPEVPALAGVPEHDSTDGPQRTGKLS